MFSIPSVAEDFEWGFEAVRALAGQGKLCCRLKVDPMILIYEQEDAEDLPKVLSSRPAQPSIRNYMVTPPTDMTGQESLSSSTLTTSSSSRLTSSSSSTLTSSSSSALTSGSSSTLTSLRSSSTVTSGSLSTLTSPRGSATVTSSSSSLPNENGTSQIMAGIPFHSSL